MYLFNKSKIVPSVQSIKQIINYASEQKTKTNKTTIQPTNQPTNKQTNQHTNLLRMQTMIFSEILPTDGKSYASYRVHSAIPHLQPLQRNHNGSQCHKSI